MDIKTFERSGLCLPGFRQFSAGEPVHIAVLLHSVPDPLCPATLQELSKVADLMYDARLTAF